MSNPLIGENGVLTYIGKYTGYTLAAIFSTVVIFVLLISLIMAVLYNPSISLTKAYDVCKLVPTSILLGSFNVAPSYWMAHIFFFFGYLMTNTVVLYTTDPYPGAADDKVRNRKYQALTAFIISILVLLILLYLRLKTGCETGLGILIATIMIPLGIGWYYFASISGARNADIFGIISQMLVPGAGQPTAQVCVNTGT